LKKVSVIGAGNVGATAVYHLADLNLAQVVMVDVVEGLPQAKASDFVDASGLRGYGVPLIGTNDYKDIEGSDVVIMTAGIARKPGMDRMDLLKTNVNIAKSAAQAVRKYAPESVLLVVTNPLDVIAMVMLRESRFPWQRVVGMAGVLDSTRFRYFIAEELGVWPGDVEAMVLGGHGDEMVPLTRYTSVGGIPITDLMDAPTIERLVTRTRKGGGEIVNYLKTGSAYYAPGASAARMAEAVLRGETTLIAASAHLQGQYGYHDIFLGVPVRLGGKGIEEVLEIQLSPEEKQALDKSAEAVAEGVKTLESIYTPG
jgi:malate dehydrogenase